MPRFGYVGRRDVNDLIAYVQSLGGELADARMEQQLRWRKEVLSAYRKGPDENIRWLHSRVPYGWRILPNPYPPSEGSLARGEKVYQDYCLGCHGPVGDGNGPAASHLNPRPLNFTTLQRHLIDNKYIGGIIYYQVMNCITGSAMPYFKKHLESAKIWDVGNYVSVYFINHRDDQYPTEGIPASYEGREAGPSTPAPQPGPMKGGKGAAR
jgi:mono/diheme cytochrome c family protein